MSKRRAFFLLVAAALLVAIAARLTGESDLLNSWWLAIGAGTLAMLLSRARTATFIAVVLALVTAVVTVASASTLLAGNAGVLALGLLALSTLAQLLTVRGLAMFPERWRSSAKYETQSANPWNSVDQGIDPTL